MAGSYHEQVHEENLKRMEKFQQVSKKNRYRKCEVVEKVKTSEGVKELGAKRALFHGCDGIKQVIDASPMIGGHPGGQIAYTMGIVEYLDGTVDRVYPELIRFLDTEDFTEDCNE